MEILKERREIALVKIDTGYYVVGIDRGRGQVSSAVPADRPKGGGLWVARATPAGVRYVANPRSKSTAMRWFRRLVREATGWDRASE